MQSHAEGTLMQRHTKSCANPVSLFRSVCETFLQAGMWTWGHSSLGSSAPSPHDAVFWKYVCVVCMFVELCSPSMFLSACSSSLCVSCSSIFCFRGSPRNVGAPEQHARRAPQCGRCCAAAGLLADGVRPGLAASARASLPLTHSSTAVLDC